MGHPSPQRRISMAAADAFAYVDARSADAATAMRLKPNRRFLDTIPTGPRRRPACPCEIGMRLDFAHLLGRRCLAFGVSRLSEVLLPWAPDFAATHFIIHFDQQSGTLTLTDTSNTGTWYQTTTQKQPVRLVDSSTTLSDETSVYIGSDLRCHFRFRPIRLNEAVRNARLRDWAESIIQPLAVRLRRQSSSGRVGQACGQKRRRSSQGSECPVIQRQRARALKRRGTGKVLGGGSERIMT